MLRMGRLKPHGRPGGIVDASIETGQNHGTLWQAGNQFQQPRGCRNGTGGPCGDHRAGRRRLLPVPDPGLHGLLTMFGGIETLPFGLDRRPDSADHLQELQRLFPVTGEVDIGDEIRQAVETGFLGGGGIEQVTQLPRQSQGIGRIAGQRRCHHQPRQQQRAVERRKGQGASDVIQAAQVKLVLVDIAQRADHWQQQGRAIAGPQESLGQCPAGAAGRQQHGDLSQILWRISPSGEDAGGKPVEERPAGGNGEDGRVNAAVHRAGLPLWQGRHGCRHPSSRHDGEGHAAGLRLSRGRKAG